MKSVDKMRLVSSLARSFSLGTIKVALICATEIANVIRLETIYAKLTIFELYLQLPLCYHHEIFKGDVEFN